MGYLLLEGGAEFGGAMREPDLRAIELAGGFEAPIRIFPPPLRRIITTSAPGTTACAGSKIWVREM